MMMVPRRGDPVVEVPEHGFYTLSRVHDTRTGDTSLVTASGLTRQSSWYNAEGLAKMPHDNTFSWIYQGKERVVCALHAFRHLMVKDGEGGARGWEELKRFYVAAATSGVVRFTLPKFEEPISASVLGAVVVADGGRVSHRFMLSIVGPSVANIDVLQWGQQGEGWSFFERNTDRPIAHYIKDVMLE